VALSAGMNVVLKGLSEKSVQGDSVLPEIFSNLGVGSSFTSEGLQIEKSGKPAIREFNYDFTNCPDLAQAVIVTSAALGIKGHFTGLKTLRVKETDRIEALRKELTKLGYRIDVAADEIFLPGGKPAIISSYQPIVIHCYDDHRMAMSFAPLALMHDKICLDEPEVIRKSYPGYWTDIAQVGLVLK
jgi:3-phosphoshikimate 1-carboxyvinyltransferase